MTLQSSPSDKERTGEELFNDMIEKMRYRGKTSIEDKFFIRQSERLDKLFQVWGSHREQFSLTDEQCIYLTKLIINDAGKDKLKCIWLRSESDEVYEKSKSRGNGGVANYIPHILTDIKRPEHWTDKFDDWSVEI